MFRYLFAGLIGLCLFSSPVQAQEQDGLLPVEQAFVFRYTLAAPGRIALQWDVAPDYYLYRSRITAKTSQPGLTLAAPDLPPGIPKHDEFFGDVEIYHGAVEGSLAYTLTDPAATAIELTVTVQGCHEVEPLICYPPHPTRLRLELPPATATSAAAVGGLAGLGSGSGGSLIGQVTGQDALPEEKAFVFEAIASAPGEILARWTMPDGYYLYRDKTELALEDAAGMTLGALRWPPGVDHVDEHFGSVVVYYHQVELPVALRRSDGAAGPLKLRAAFQGCKENGICYPVMIRTVDVALPALTDAELAKAQAGFVPAAAAPDASAADASAENALRSTPPETGTGTLAGALLLALLGGLVLNLMPCVLPVLSLKVIGLAQSGESLTKARSHALWYTLGVLVSFAAIGLLVIALRAAGQALGWGFQLQQPAFVALLVYVLLAVGLSLSGVFSIGSGLAGTGQNLANRSGPAGDFFTGVLACIVASPCTAPFMGPALGFAFASSSLVALLIFLALGLGLALPFLIVGFVPALASRLPKPGAWMETLKQVLAFPMYLTAVWLIWVLGKQRGVDAIGLVLAGAVVLALGLWWFERSRWSGRPLVRALVVAVVLAALVPIVGITRLPPPAVDAAAIEAQGAVPYSREKLAALRTEGRTVFVNMTADWCVTCKANEKNVLGSAHFRERLAAANAVYMKGDWTNVDPEITAFLQEHRAVGVPLYVVFRGREEPGRVLPTLLTDAIVAEALAPAVP
ncbi:protein-disulfide reductase DsbD family protein [Dokdonella koreensis]|uniref:C-type cytochrome biogenesis protein n=1 Tax=Dokdonella koreensis DS-123 TaxID=1300342 RepID=A0A160DZP6_9GAMM|nr:protein-disulfide reductase DsbD [Dokdonella koreensis]ANB19683.1 C-type cytochrome biogenesis protein [Dokdonella koreensis DS-123]